jgi:putative transposase
MKRTYQIDREKAVREFRTAAGKSSASIQLGLPMKEAAELVQQGLMHLALAAFTQVAEQMMRWDVDRMVGPKNTANALRDLLRWGNQQGFCVVSGQKVPIKRPRVRAVRGREVPLGS